MLVLLVYFHPEANRMFLPTKSFFGTRKYMLVIIQMKILNIVCLHNLKVRIYSKK